MFHFNLLSMRRLVVICVWNKVDVLKFDECIVLYEGHFEKYVDSPYSKKRPHLYEVPTLSNKVSAVWRCGDGLFFE